MQCVRRNQRYSESEGSSTARTGKLCEEETFAAEEDVSKAFDRLNFIFYGFLERNDISCINFGSLRPVRAVSRQHRRRFRKAIPEPEMDSG